MSSIIRVDSIIDKDNDNEFFDVKNKKIKNCSFKTKSINFNKKFKNPIVVNQRFTSSGTVNLSLTSSNGIYYVPDTEISMGVPKSEKNWFRVHFQSISDDMGDGGNSGIGYYLYRYVVNYDTTWMLLYGQGRHAQYENNLGDFYYNTTATFYTQAVDDINEHKYRIYAYSYDATNRRINSSIGGDLRQYGWVNNCMEITEYNGDFVDSGLFGKNQSSKGHLFDINTYTGFRDTLKGT